MKMLKLQAPFAFREFDPEQRVFVPITDEAKILAFFRKMSPRYHVSADDPPTLIAHGDKDSIVPLQQAETIVAKFQEVGLPVELIVKPGAEHGWGGMAKDLATFADWFDKYLGGKK